MSRRRGPAIAFALLGAALAVAGCGFGPGAEVGEVTLTVTRDFGARPVAGPLGDAARESDTVMRVLDRNADVETRYGGGFVSSIDGIAESSSGGVRRDWFFYVNGVESPVGAAEFSLRGGEAIWWDYRVWGGAARVPAVVGSWPQPFAGGYEGHSHPTRVECDDATEQACAIARERLRRAGAEAGADGAIRVLVGPWRDLRRDAAAAQLESGPAESGVFARFERRRGGWTLSALDESGAAARELGPSAGLVAATRRFGAPPVWLVTGANARGVAAAAKLLDAADLRDHYAVATEGGDPLPLPLR